jgi:hypothetical protein
VTAQVTACGPPAANRARIRDAAAITATNWLQLELHCWCCSRKIFMWWRCTHLIDAGRGAGVPELNGAVLLKGKQVDLVAAVIAWNRSLQVGTGIKASTWAGWAPGGLYT